MNSVCCYCKLKNILLDIKLTEMKGIKTGARKIHVKIRTGVNYVLFGHFRCSLSALKHTKIEITHYHSK